MSEKLEFRTYKSICQSYFLFELILKCFIQKKKTSKNSLVFYFLNLILFSEKPKVYFLFVLFLLKSLMENSYIKVFKFFFYSDDLTEVVLI